jgi:hypothetical protein
VVWDDDAVLLTQEDVSKPRCDDVTLTRIQSLHCHVCSAELSTVVIMAEIINNYCFPTHDKRLHLDTILLRDLGCGSWCLAC